MKKKESGVSEILGALLLVSVVMGGITMVSLLMFSSPPPNSIPQVTISGYCCNKIQSDGSSRYIIIISHNGGDSIRGSDLNIIVNNQSNRSVSFYPDGVINTTIPNPLIQSNEFFKEGSALMLDPTAPVPDPKNITVEIYPDHSGRNLVKRLAILKFNCTMASCGPQ